MITNTGTVTLRLYGALRHAAGGREFPLDTPVTTVKEALTELVQAKGPRLGAMIFDRHGDVWASLILLVNDEPAEHRERAHVSPGDTISILVPLAGG
jgi:molybdopterin converting factor small subunit